ncbi:MAG: hypothetical protein COA95_07500 [Methylophaga sp.]|nr:MAG: hypothetical protein COA95_07500 [Methylophaga sp.]
MGIKTNKYQFVMMKRWCPFNIETEAGSIDFCRHPLHSEIMVYLRLNIPPLNIAFLSAMLKGFERYFK